MNVFYGESFKNKPTGLLQKTEITSFEDFCNTFLKTCHPGEKNSHYITIGDSYTITKGDESQHPNSYKYKDHYHRNNKSQQSAWLLPFDGDSSLTDKDSCIKPIIVHETLTKLGYNHVVYTTHSHVKDIKNRWRLLIPCKMDDIGQLKPTFNSLYSLLLDHGCYGLAKSNESMTWALPWYLPSRDNPDDGHYEYYTKFDGKDFEPVEVDTSDDDSEESLGEDSRTVSEMIRIIQEGKANTGLHRATRDLAYGLVNDGVKPAMAKSILHGLTRGYDPTNERHKENKNKIDSLVDTAAGKVRTAYEDLSWGELLPGGYKRIYTNYPEQSGMMGMIVDSCLAWMPYPNRQIATIAAHALISTLSGRVYTFNDGSGVVLTALVTGRSTIGKSFIKKFCMHALNNFQLARCAHQFIGSHFYTSSKNLIEELKESGTLLSVRTESGQSDKSQAGDMTRVMLYELELATNSGMSGYVSSGGQNDKIPALFSPSVTTIRESVAEVQHEADLQNAAMISGVSGRRSHVLIDDIKPEQNMDREFNLPKEMKKLLATLYKFADMSERKNVTSYLENKFWIKIGYEDREYLRHKQSEWLDLENKATEDRNAFASTFYGRLHERLQSWAGRLAICDDPSNPIITRDHINIAEASLLSELEAVTAQKESGMLDGDIQQSVNFIMRMFKGDMTKNTSLSSTHKKHHQRMLLNKAIKMSVAFNQLRQRNCWKAAFAKNQNAENVIKSQLKSCGVNILTPQESKEQFNFNGYILQVQS